MILSFDGAKVECDFATEENFFSQLCFVASRKPLESPINKGEKIFQ